jgi:dipeptidyl aminopeptidase/acylaminoacyl peptidase
MLLVVLVVGSVLALGGDVGAGVALFGASDVQAATHARSVMASERERFTDISVALSPAGDRIAYWRQAKGARRAALYVARADGSAPRLLARGGGGSAPLWSKDGRWIAFERVQIFVVPSTGGRAGGRARQLTSLEVDAVWPIRWRGNRILDYGVEDCCINGTDYTYEESVTIGGTQLFRPDYADDCSPLVVGCDFSPDGQSVTYEDAGEVQVKSRAGVRDLGTGSLPTWLPDGSRVVFLAGPPEQAILVDVRPDGSDQRILSGGVTGAVSSYMVSNRGDRVLFVAPLDGVDKLWIATTNGLGARLVDGAPAHAAGSSQAVSWSPNDRWLVWYLSDRDALTLDVMHPDGTARHELARWHLHDPTGMFDTPEFSSLSWGGHKDTTVAYVDRPLPACGEADAIFRLPTTHTRPVQLTHPCAAR